VRRTIILGAFLTGACAGAAALAGCPDNTNPAILPITTVDVDIADILKGANLVCGTGDDDVFKYATVVTLVGSEAGAPDAEESDADIRAACTPNLTGAVSAGVSACFYPAVFSNLPLLADGGVLPDGGSVIYAVQVFLYNQKTYCSLQADPTCPAKDQKDKILSAISVEGNGTTLCDLPYSWKATCIANEQNDIAVNAACTQIEAGIGAPVADAGAEDGGTAAQADAGAADAADENSLDATGDATGDEADAGAPADATGG
jgi:hypothetical protein